MRRTASAMTASVKSIVSRMCETLPVILGSNTRPTLSQSPANSRGHQEPLAEDAGDTGDADPSGESTYEIPRLDRPVEPEPQVIPEVEASLDEAAAEAPFQAELFSTTERDPAVVRAAADLVVGARRASATFLQRRLRVGYDEAIELLDELRAEGVVGGSVGDAKGPLLVDPEAWGD